jgi:hypothetical protein
MHPTSNTELGKLEGVIWVSRGPQHGICCNRSPNTCMLYFVVWLMVNGIGRFTYCQCANRGDCLKATVMEDTRKVLPGREAERSKERKATHRACGLRDR